MSTAHAEWMPALTPVAARLLARAIELLEFRLSDICGGPSSAGFVPVKTVPNCWVAAMDTLTMKWVVLPSDTTNRQVICEKDCEAISIYAIR